MKTTVNFTDFTNAFKAIRPDNFTYEGLGLLWDYFESYEQDTNEELELDVIAICCEYAEESIEQIIRSYGVDCDDVEDDELDQHIMNFLCDNTSVMGQTDNGTIVFQQF